MIKAFASVANGKLDEAFAHGEHDGGALRVGVAAHIGESFLNDAKDGALDHGTELGFIDQREIEGDIQISPRAEGFDVPLQACNKAEIVEDLRAQRAADVADRLENFVRERVGFGDDFLRLLGVGAFTAAEGDLESGQVLADLVVQFAGDAALFGFVSENKLFAEGAQTVIALAEFVSAFAVARLQPELRFLEFGEQ